MTIRLPELSTLMVLALIGGVLWLLRQNAVSVVAVPSWTFDEVEQEEDLPTWDDLT